VRRPLALLLVILGLASAALIRIHLSAQPALAAGEIVEIHSAHGASYIPALEGKRPLFILALGSDARPGQQVLRERSDSIHIIGVNLVTHKATILGFPRDSWVHIPGHGSAKITTAMSFGGPALTVATIEALTGIRIDFWLLTTFQGIVRIVNSVGPLRVRVTQAMHDRFSGANFSVGLHKFRGNDALAFARDRHDFSQGDITRSANQGKLMQAALDKFQADFERDVSRLFTWLAVGWRNIHTDLSPAVLLQLALTATQISPNRVNNLVVPSSTGSVGAQSVVFIQGGASRIYARMRATGISQ
jgi:LCP family protein required for cell wall assembly